VLEDEIPVHNEQSRHVARQQSCCYTNKTTTNTYTSAASGQPNQELEAGILNLYIGTVYIHGHESSAQVCSGENAKPEGFDTQLNLTQLAERGEGGGVPFYEAVIVFYWRLDFN
jgi:hypothetical protein